MRKLATGLAVGLAALTLGGCGDILNVKNTNNPNTEQVLSTPGSVEALIGGLYQTLFVGINGSNDDIDNQLKSVSWESFSSVANYGMIARVSIPRAPLNNERGNDVGAGNYRDFQRLQVLARSASVAIAALDRLSAASTTPVLGSVGKTQMARAFAFFNLGAAQGLTAMVYDSLALVDPTVPTTTVPGLSDYATGMTHALAMLDSAIAVATSASSVADDANFVVPSTYIDRVGGSFTRAQFIQLVRSYKARLRAGVARNPTERAAVDWAAVVADAKNGLPNGLVINVINSGSAAWPNAWISSQYRYQGWHNMSNHFIGMADTSGAYAAWVATPDASKGAILIKSPDLRLPSGETRAAQQANSYPGSAPPSTSREYFRNRPTGEDTPVFSYGQSYYDHNRFLSIFLSPSGSGPWPEIAKTEMDMLIAEGELRPGTQQNVNEAITYINLTRATSGLTPIPAGATVVPFQTGSSVACVPRVPTGTGATTACGSVMEAMKYEKRMETAMTGYGQWYFDSRGWGDLPEGTALSWPIPWQEADARTMPIYSLGGVGCTNGSCAARSTYGAW